MVAKLKSAFLDIANGSLKSTDAGRYPVAWVEDHRGLDGGARKRQAGDFRDARAGVHRPGPDEGRASSQGRHECVELGLLRRWRRLSLLCPGLRPGAFGAEPTAESRLSGLRLNGDEPIQIESDKLEVRENENKAIFTGNVSVTQGPTILKSGTHDRLSTPRTAARPPPARRTSSGSRSTARSMSSPTSRSPPATTAPST